MAGHYQTLARNTINEKPTTVVTRHLIQMRFFMGGLVGSTGFEPAISTMIAQECDQKLGETTINVSAPLHAFDAGGRARALSGVVAALAMAKEGGITPEQVAAAMKFAGVPEQ